MIKKIINKLLIIAGIINVMLGVAGLFLPLLPTTPFFLLAAAFFFRSSDRLYTWLINHRLFGNYIRFYREYRAVTPFAKITSIILLWVTIAYSVIFEVESVWIKLILIFIALGVSIHIYYLRTLTRELKENWKKEQEGLNTLTQRNEI